MKGTNNVRGLVLVVDDDIPSLKLISYLLGQFHPNVETHVAQNGEDALIRIEKSKYDVIIIDYFLTDMEGEELASMIKSNACKALILMTTASDEVCKKGKQVDRYDYVCKGGKFSSELMDTVDTYLNMASIRRETYEIRIALENFTYVDGT